MFIAGLFTIVSTWKQPKYPSAEEWIKKKWFIDTMEYHSTMKVNEIISFAATWMDLESVIISTVSQTEKGKYITYVWNAIDLRQNFFFWKPQFVFLRPLAYCMRPTHIIEGKLFYVKSTDFTSTHLHNSYMVAISTEEFTVMLRILLD